LEHTISQRATCRDVIKPEWFRRGPSKAAHSGPSNEGSQADVIETLDGEQLSSREEESDDEERLTNYEGGSWKSYLQVLTLKRMALIEIERLG